MLFALTGLGWVLVASAAASVKDSVMYDSLGNLAPYHKAPVPSGVSEQLPKDCSVEQVMLMGRHGSRYPLADELVFITNLTAKLATKTATLRKARLPSELAFLKSGYVSTLGHDDLTAIGRRQLFDHGVDFRLKYAHLAADSILAGDQDRVVESAEWFAQGYFGRAWANLSTSAFATISENSSTISWITSPSTCPKWQFTLADEALATWGAIYLPSITRRLNRLVPGVNFTNDDAHGALYACAYDYAAHGVSPWCNVFTPQELTNFEYELDLLMDSAFGYNLPGDMGPILGTLYVNKLIERFSNATGDSKPVYLEFGHDTSIDFALTALGLAKDTPPLSPKGPVRHNRKFRTSQQVPFAAQMIWEKFTCNTSFKGPQIRLVLNDAPFPLRSCAHSTSDSRYGSCSFENFVKANSFSTSVEWGDAKWNATCGELTVPTS